MFKRARRILGTILPFIFSKKNKNRLKMVGAGMIDLMTTAINVAVPVMLVDRYSSKNADPGPSVGESSSSSEHFVPLVIGAGALLIARVLPIARNLLISSVQANTQKELTQAMEVQAYTLPHNDLLTMRTGEFSQGLSKNYSTIDKSIPSFFGEILPTSLEVVGTSVILTIKYGPVGIIQLGTLALYGFVAIYNEERTEPIRKACVDKSYSVYGTVLEVLAIAKTARQFGNEAHELKRSDDALTDSETHYRRNHYKDNYNAFKLSLINNFGFIGALAYVLLQPPKGTFDPITFALISYFLNRFNARLEAFPGAISAFYTGFADADRVATFLIKKSTVVDIANPVVLNTVDPLGIEFKDVVFNHGTKRILNKVSFTILPKQKVAIVGPSGSGKSTITNLIQRLYSPAPGGVISIAGHDISTLSGASLRKHLSVVSQDSSLFDATVAENIRYGDLVGATDEDIAKVARFAELFDEVPHEKARSSSFSSLHLVSPPDSRSSAVASIQGDSKQAKVGSRERFGPITSADFKDNGPKKLQAKAGPNGNLLSGGEKQRISIARAVLRGASIFILDEPTSSLDPKTESEIQKTPGCCDDRSYCGTCYS